MANNKKVKKPVAKKTVVKKSAPAAKKPVKTLKSNKKVIATKPAKKAVVSKKPVAKALPKKKPVVNQVKKAVKPAAKVVVKKAATPVKAPVKTVAKAPAKAIVVKAPVNQNPTATKKPQVVLQKTANGLKATAPQHEMARPAYRPIQVINRSLAPLQPVRMMAPAPAPAAEKAEYKKGDYVVYPAHGVGQIEAIETQTIGGMDIKLYAIVFEKDRMRLKVPVFKAHASGLRRLSTTNRMQDALKTLQGRAQIRRAMWSRRAQEYETKINSGDPVAIAEVLRDLKRSNDDSEQSYSERQIYQSALERLAREVAAVERIPELEAVDRLEKLIKGRKAKSDSDKSEKKEDVAEAA